MNALIGFAFCVLTGAMIKQNGFSALLWTPLGFAFGLVVSAQIFLPLLVGIPRALRLVARGHLRATVCARILVAPITWVLVIALLGVLWPSAREAVYANTALNLGANLGTLAILVSLFTAKGRGECVEDLQKLDEAFLTESGHAARNARG